MTTTPAQQQPTTTASNATLRVKAGQVIQMWQVSVPTKPFGSVYVVRHIAAASAARALRIAAKQAGDWRGLRVRDAMGRRVY